MIFSGELKAKTGDDRRYISQAILAILKLDNYNIEILYKSYNGKNILTTKHTKYTKEYEVFFRVFRVFRGNI